MTTAFKVIVLFLFCTHVISAQNPFIKDSLDVYVMREMKCWKIPGMALAVVKDGKIVVMKGYGVRENGKDAKVDENTLFQIASNSKAFTGTALSLLSFQKRLSLDDKVNKWIKDYKLNDELTSREVSIRDLLCHRIGFETFQSDFLNWGSNLSRKELIYNMRKVKPVYGFRNKWGYCNAAFLTAGEVIPAVTDTTWDDFLKYHFFQPLKNFLESTKIGKPKIPAAIISCSALRKNEQSDLPSLFLRHYSFFPFSRK